MNSVLHHPARRTPVATEAKLLVFIAQLRCRSTVADSLHRRELGRTFCLLVNGGRVPSVHQMDGRRSVDICQTRIFPGRIAATVV